MPWSAKDAKSHTKKASSPKAQRQWAHVADTVLQKTGDDVKAIRAANSVINKRSASKKLGVK